MLNIYDISINSNIAPDFIAAGDIKLGWKLKSSNNGVFQESYRILINDSEAKAVYDSGIVSSSESTEINCKTALNSDSDYLLKITVTDNYGESAVGEYAFSTALKKENIKGCYIKPKRHIEGWAPYIRRKFECCGELSRAVLYVSGLGCGEYYINGRKISDDYIDPPQTNYESEIFYRAYDVLEFLDAKNAFTALLGEGWYSQSRVWAPSVFKYGDCILWAQLELTYVDGRKETIYTADDGNWKFKYSPIVLNNLYGGETYDCRLETPDFALYDGEDGDWGDCKADDEDVNHLKLCQIPPVRIIREIPAVSVKQASGLNDGAWIIDLGENFAGIAEFHIPNAPRGAQYVFRYAETINKDGTLDHRSIGSYATQCIQQDIYIARGDEEGEVYRPRFTYHAYRYIEVTGYHDLREYGSNPEITFAVGYALSTDIRENGSFECSDSDLNYLQKIMMNTLRSNIHGHPEDCPGREKCGWLGDAQVVCNTGMYNYDMESCYEKYLHDIRTECEDYGTWMMIAPGKRTCGDATPLWGCAQIIIPYYMYKYYGNRNVITENWKLMKAWVEHEKADSINLLIIRGLGDWCPPDEKRKMPVPESSTAMFYEICIRMAELCDEFGYEGKEYYLELADSIKKAFIAKFYNSVLHRYSTWGTNGVALSLGLYPDGEYDALMNATLKQIKDEDYALSGGIYANKYLFPVLAQAGHFDYVMETMFNRRHISFGTMIDGGATSVWEDLNMKGIGQPREHGCASYNHPMHTGFAYFLYEQLAGIKPLEPGFAKFEISPCLSSLEQVHAYHDTPYGRITVDITRGGEKITKVDFTVPENTSCILKIDGKNTEYCSGTYSFCCD